jgi:hypothetical protein
MAGRVLFPAMNRLRKPSPKSPDEVVREPLVTLEEVRVIAYQHGTSPDAGDPHVATDPNATVLSFQKCDDRI